jgi:hypothetical protein
VREFVITASVLAEDELDKASRQCEGAAARQAAEV